MMMTTRIAPFRLKPWFSKRVWGKQDLRPWYSDTGTSELVGEAWLTGPQCVIETGVFAGREFASVATELGGEFPLLVKLLFPNEKLSVQVHPDDAQARAMGETRGKTECWYVLEAEPGAYVSLGLKDGVDAGTVHAIGPGVVLLETQQTSDVTYRLYDYGRPRELHLEKGLAVMKAETAAGKVAARVMNGFTRLIEQTYFVVDRFDVGAANEANVSFAGPGCLVGLSGRAVVITADGDVELKPGQAVVVPQGSQSVIVEAGVGVSFVRCMAPVSR
ncbi:MAG: type I phosphomannose isomerase catalytic subunit [Edaphobacter sp.]